ncbi:MAG: peptidase M61 [Cytophagaceae bacterium SCN 52-12]|nr:MAG: peptidase M61 [Cytophagaceae bacterium SCN 52-12]
MHYLITAARPENRFLEIRYTIDKVSSRHLEVQLPAWRPGRYELQNFAKNIRTFSVTDDKGSSISFQKITKDRWRLDTENCRSVTITYTYYANQQNAGSSYIDAALWYLNFINFCLYTEGRIDEPCEIELLVPENYTIACGLTASAPGRLQAKDFYQLVDSPLLASPRLKHLQFESRGVPFHVWFEGITEFDNDRLLKDFRAFTDAQIAAMGEFPEKEYHFLNLILPTAFYHGVEHRNSTMVVLGPQDEGENLYTDLLGVSSHELFHAWNVIRIRPKELLPYDFTRENYFTTCFVAEGCTTYYGDLFLRRSGVFDDEAYLKELHVYMKRHFEQAGQAALSLTESSFDLWLDGYEAGIPQRKVSVYMKGALAALILDLYLRKISGHTRSLDNVMQLMWQRFGRPFTGYSYQDYVSVAEEVAGHLLTWYWEECINGNVPLEARLNEALAFVGLEMYHDELAGVMLRDNAGDTDMRERNRWLGNLSILQQG